MGLAWKGSKISLPLADENTQQDRQSQNNLIRIKDPRFLRFRISSDLMPQQHNPSSCSPLAFLGRKWRLRLDLRPYTMVRKQISIDQVISTSLNWRYYYIAGTAIVLGIIAVCLFPLWPMEARQVGLKRLGKLISWEQIISFDSVSFNLFLPIPVRWIEKVLNYFFGNLSNHKIGGRLLSFHCNFYLLLSPIYLKSIIV